MSTTFVSRNLQLAFVCFDFFPSHEIDFSKINDAVGELSAVDADNTPIRCAISQTILYLTNANDSTAAAGVLRERFFQDQHVPHSRRKRFGIRIFPEDEIQRSVVNGKE